MKHLLSVADLSTDALEKIFDLTNHYLDGHNSEILKDKTIINLFFENSTRTLLSFEIAEKTLGANAITLNPFFSSISKGESIKDTVLTLNSMNPDIIIIRSRDNFFLKMMIQVLSCRIINAGDGMHEHPTQSLINCFTILYVKNRIKDLNIVICGDVKHSRVARSDIKLLNFFEAKITIVAPPTLMYNNINNFKYSYSCTLSDQILRDADVIMLLRIQRERLGEGGKAFISSEREYANLYCLNEKRLLQAKQDLLILHPGPINRDTEIESVVADNRSAILLQVKIGVAIRKAIFHYLMECNEI